MLNNAHLLLYTHTCLSLKLCSYNFLIYLAENKDPTQSEGSESTFSTSSDEDSAESDVEERGYCTDTSSVEINLKLARVTNPEIRALLNNTDKVSANMY